MLIFEVENPQAVDSAKLMALSQFLTGRADDTNAKKEISTQAFIQMAQNLGVQVTPDTVADIIAKPPLSNVLQPYDQNSGTIRFKGNEEPGEEPMDTEKAQQVVNQNAKSALNRRT